MPAIDDVVRAMRGNRAELDILVAKIECDYWLDVLFKALKTENHEQVEESKARLHELRRELLLLEA
ncbi:hypothetical protein [Brevibacillus laterosporus]|uniref:hypothetical protein n=1 Tax=Brevibacillus laterosporus TaxID=1465 RepID=UPI002E1C5E8A|nr:hypothetical protein [Brevibacillus laterosporus]MED1670328.1 hypothetical protein [Brevibacillus laterosporus]MED1717877.1 hypothetical protein [Brevibacillus laterosporus]